MKPLLIAILLLFINCHCYAQKEFDNMAISSGLIYNVNSDEITKLDKKVQYGQFAVSDEDGNLLFYGDACNIFDKNGASLYSSFNGESGLSGSSCIAISPKNHNQYFIFNSYYKQHYHEFENILFVAHYFIVTNTNGKLTVEERILNQFENRTLTDGCLFARMFPYPDKDKIWFVYYYTDKFVSCLMDGNDIIKTVESNCDIFDDVDNTHSALIKNIISNPEYNMAILFKNGIIDFDNFTGKITRNNTFKMPDDMDTYAFSQSGKYLYAAMRLSVNEIKISRFMVADLSKGIVDNEEVIFTYTDDDNEINNTLSTSNFYLHPNSTIYAFYGKRYLSKIENADADKPIITIKAVRLPKSGLTVVADYFHPITNSKSFCETFADKKPKIICE
ncbi:MAG: hypothetical protein IKP73_02570 [Bacteroidales bacterium]|nr:hypothetical protein [Bacteroidales bacterium]